MSSLENSNRHKPQLLYIGNQLAIRGGTPTSVDILAPLLEKEGFRVKSSSDKKNQVLRLMDMLLKVVKHSSWVDYVLIDTYSTKNFWYAYAVAHVCQKLDLKYIPILHGGDLPERLQNSPKACRSLFSHAHTNVAPSIYLKKAFQQVGYEEVLHIPNNIHLEDYPFKERKKIKPKLLWVRSFSGIYNPLLALKALEILQKKYPLASLCMVGPEKDGSMKVCKEYAAQLGLSVKFTGKLEKEEWTELSADYDIFLNTTNVDNTPVSLIEAMALGLLVVSTRVGGVPNLIEDQKEGLLVAPENPEKMAAAVEEILENPTRATSFSLAARQKVESYDWNLVKMKWIELLS